jgi:cell division protein FtsL
MGFTRGEKLIILAALVAAFVMNGVPHWWD